MGNEELWAQPALEMPKRRDILAIVLIVLPWTLLVTVWHQSTIAPLLAAHKGRVCCSLLFSWSGSPDPVPPAENRLDRDDGSDPRREAPPGADPREYCMSDRDIVEVVRTEYVYTRPPPWSDTLPTIHVVTPTYSRPVQKAELTRLANTLLHVPNLHWLVVEDAPRRTPLTARLLRDTGLNYTHLHVETPRNYKLRGDARDPRIPRGTMQRNLALRWLRETFPRNSSQPGVVYFADDDNTYSLELFEEMRSTRRVSVWPVAFVGGLRYEAPRVNGAGKVVGWKTVFDPHRPFAIDMAGFAVNLRLILQRSQAYFKLRGVKGGYQESSLLRELVTLSDLEPKAANCTKEPPSQTCSWTPVLPTRVVPPGRTPVESPSSSFVLWGLQRDQPDARTKDGDPKAQIPQTCCSVPFALAGPAGADTMGPEPGSDARLGGGERARQSSRGLPGSPSRPHDHTGHLARDCGRQQAAPTPGIRNELLREMQPLRRLSCGSHSESA
ncbi:galactosylgalactosylxylosylprotein 3-beta-glucuronosyltransferase 1 isoform X1 [Physeter macrocephalus]|uniref:Galactosylgalactosylxylosylprotein 3-beta-glucuronosyltransferase n=3 Tax=Physeter macrocephalus TaxID=9755 RepID=A0A455CBW1_PHYMC|nr:galactosylgalactosylxylosylprotein 3-beta-glucuronosyltransferase 1 isoform X1 [Physeter catodon]XP_028357122.1 galactosylgalactosylxylosylprotein 3-beta-glucuronosyltransferase 1 isoform X1 [Physeter catodon]|eukprot:XP_028357121.1 galactosylgalactosylxylosylprotein 3-beta-glucuronosyltransferase 1 isoform X1 [Physeter catodon]